MPISTGFNHVATVTADLDRIVRFYQTIFDAVVTFEVAARDDLDQVHDRLTAAGVDIGTIHRLGDIWSLFFRDPDGMELEVCTPVWPVHPSTGIWS